MNKENRTTFYENTDFSELLKSKKGKKIGVAAKRITLNISGQIYDEANELDLYMRMGYQNVLKTAMTIGLTELYNQVSHHQIEKPKETRLPSWQTRKKALARKLQSAHRATAPGGKVANAVK